MRVFNKSDASQILGGGSLDDFVDRLSQKLPIIEAAYAIPADSGRKTALSRLIAYLLLGRADACIYVSGWGVWRSAENLDLFYGYRRSIGESRPLIEAPFHLFERSEEPSFVSILCLVLYFVWDAWVFDIGGKTLVKISHDEWLEVRADDVESRKEFAAELEKFELLLSAK